VTSVARPARHDEIIRDAAREHLRPIGLTQKGRSRTWFGDEGWWVSVVEFRPGRAKGTSLNVAATWLWHVRERFAFDVAETTRGFLRYDSDASFTPAVRGLAALAVEQVAKLRREFAGLEGVAAHAWSTDSPAAWMNAGVALGLLHRPVEARAAFDRYLEVRDDRDQAILKRAKIIVLRDLLETPEAFDSSVEHSIRESRTALRLDPSVQLVLR
jgi:hypothetical protein